MSAKKKLKIYLSGPMRNTTPDQNLALFTERSKQLRARGFVVFDPHEISREIRIQELGPERADDYGAVPFETFLRHDYKYIADSDLVAVLPGWEKSVGCVKEVRVARDLLIPVHPVQRILDFCDSATGMAGLAQKSLELPESAVQEAHRLVHGSRMADYGHPIDDYTRTGRIWGAILDGWLRTQPGFETMPPVPDVDPRIAGLMMSGVKMSREVNKPKHDNRVDLAGYAEVVELIAQRQEMSSPNDV